MNEDPSGPQALATARLGPALGARRGRKRANRHDVPLQAGLIILAAFTFYPFIFLLVSSLKDVDQFQHTFWLPALPPHLENYGQAALLVLPYLRNSLIVTSASAFGVLSLSTVSAYVFARYPFPGREILFMGIIILLIVPGILTLIPQFLLARRLGLLDTYWALILFDVAGGQVFGIFIMRSFFSAMPGELFEAARMDGAGEVQVFWQIAVPLAAAIMVTVVIIDVLSTWNDYIWPLVTLQSEYVKTFPLGLIGLQNALQVNYGELFAAYVVASLPLLLLFMFTMRYFVRGLTSGAIRA
jgi:ABC-type glycerol-3-phosphate transport system permease component